MFLVGDPLAIESSLIQLVSLSCSLQLAKAIECSLLLYAIFFGYALHHANIWQWFASQIPRQNEVLAR